MTAVDWKPVYAESSPEASGGGRVCAELSPWADGRAGVGFGVMIENITTDSVEFTSCGRLTVGSQYLLEVTRRGGKSLTVTCTVTNSGKVDRARFEKPVASVEIADLVDRILGGAPKRVTTRRTKLLFIIFGIVGVAMALLLDW